MFNKIKAIKDLRDQAKTMQSEMEQIICEGSAGGGTVKITLDGTHNMKSIEVSDELLSNKSKLLETISKAHGDAVKQVQKKMANRMKEMGGLDALKNFGL